MQAWRCRDRIQACQYRLKLAVGIERLRIGDRPVFQSLSKSISESELSHKKYALIDAQGCILFKLLGENSRW
jgi:hypothetical protein